jgi:hypothetical protein
MDTRASSIMTICVQMGMPETAGVKKANKMLERLKAEVR